MKKMRKHQLDRAKVVMVSLVALAVMAVGTTLAYFLTNTPTVNNVFTPSHVTTVVDEKFDGNVKRDVRIQNTGNTAAYIRAAVVYTWQDGNGQDGNGNVYGGSAPEAGTDFNQILASDWGESGAWVLAADGFYYWTKPVAAKGYTGKLINEISMKDSANAPEGYTLCVEILGSGIQSVPTSVVKDEWQSGIRAVSEDGVLTVKQ